MSTLKLRPLGVMILALLRERDMHPYEMMRLLKDRRGSRFFRLQRGTFYHQVAALERDGLIAEAGVGREGNRPERTLYTLGPEGKDAIARWVRLHLGAGGASADFSAALAEAHNLDRAEALSLLGDRLAALRTERQDVAAVLIRVREGHVDRQYTIELERRLALHDADIAWTESFVQELSGGDFAWGAPSSAHRNLRAASARSGTRKEDA